MSEEKKILEKQTSKKALLVEMINQIEDEKYLSYIYTLLKTFIE